MQILFPVFLPQIIITDETDPSIHHLPSLRLILPYLILAVLFLDR